MKQTNFIKEIKKENLKYNAAKFISYLQMKLSFGGKRELMESKYSLFNEDFDFDKHNNSLPESFYYKPTDIIIYDLIKKEDLPKVKAGLVRLIKKCLSHKFLNGLRSEKDIDELVIQLDQTLNSGNSWYRTCLFDFAYDMELDPYIHHFDIRFHNFCSSYAAIEMQISLSESFIDEMSQFINKAYKKPGMCIHRLWGRSNKKSGAKISFGVSSGVQSESAKSQIVYEQLHYVKSRFLKEICIYFPLMQYSSNNNIFGINVFETNITPSTKLDNSVYIGLGLEEMSGFFFSLVERLYVSTLTTAFRDNGKSDMIYVYNPERITNYLGFVTPHNLALEQLTLDYMQELYRAIILKYFGLKHQDVISSYRNKINQCKPSKRTHKKLLKMKYQLNRDFYDFRKIDEELPVNESLKNARKTLSQNKYAKASIYDGFHTCEQFTDYPQWIWKQVKTNYSEVENDLARKIEISDSLYKYSYERRSRWIVIFQVLLATATFFFLVFPNKAKEFAEILKHAFASFFPFL